MTTRHDQDSDRRSEHPAEGELAAYLDGLATSEERMRIEDHLAECADCREGIVIARDAERPRSSRLRWVVGAAAVAAAIALLVLTPTMLDDATDPEDPLLRGPGTDQPTAAEIEVVGPMDTVVAATDDLRFVWRSAGVDAQYRLMVTTVAGDPVATINTADTVITLLDGVELAAATEYFWWVEVLRGDRTLAETGVQPFVRIDP